MILTQSITGLKLRTLWQKAYIDNITEKEEKTHLSISALDVLTERTSGVPASVTLNRISLRPFRHCQVVGEYPMGPFQGNVKRQYKIEE
jgi:hypothetical protein